MPFRSFIKGGLILTARAVAMILTLVKGESEGVVCLSNPNRFHRAHRKEKITLEAAPRILPCNPAGNLGAPCAGE